MGPLGPILAVVLAALIGGAANVQALRDWYPTLAKPDWNPPNAIFGPVWTVLYVLIAIAGIRALGHPRATATEAKVYYGQLTLNLAWSWIFFGMRRPDLAFFEILALLGLIAVNVVLFWRLDRTAGLLLVPYLAWVGFASVLNFTIWRMNVS